MSFYFLNSKDSVFKEVRLRILGFLSVTRLSRFFGLGFSYFSVVGFSIIFKD